MKGLLLNRWYAIRKKFFVLIITSVVIFSLNFLICMLMSKTNSEGLGFGVSILPFISFCLFGELAINSVIGDMKNNFIRFALCTPTTLKIYVIYSYLCSFLLLLLGLALYISSSTGVAALFNITIDNNEYLQNIILIVMIAFAVMIEIPIYFKVKNNNVAGLISVFILGGFFSLVMFLVNIFNPSFSYKSFLIYVQNELATNPYSLLNITGVFLCLLVMSALCSYFILKRREN